MYFLVVLKNFLNSEDVMNFSTLIVIIKCTEDSKFQEIHDHL